jgi:hypothetical protein
MRQSVRCNEHFACNCYRDEIARLEAEVKELREQLRALKFETPGAPSPRFVRRPKEQEE